MSEFAIISIAALIWVSGFAVGCLVVGRRLAGKGLAMGIDFLANEFRKLPNDWQRQQLVNTIMEECE